MKTFRFNSLIFLLLTFSGLAQTTITTTSQIGDITPFSIATSATALTVPVNTTGPNVTWDCSNLLPEPGYPIINLTVSSPQGTPYYSDYPLSNWYWTDPANVPITGHNYYSLTPDSLVLWGDHNPGHHYEIYDNPEISLKLPFSYGDIYSNNYSKTNYDENGNITSYNTGNNTLIYDGFGTLILPCGTFTNVGRIKNTRTNSLGPTTESYDWYIIATGERILNYQTNGGIKVNYRHDYTTNILNKKMWNDIKFYPNPCNQQTTLKINPEILDPGSVLRIVDLHGITIKTVSINSPETIINREGLNSGVYFCILESKDRITGKVKLVIF
jgi:hypothetical protein